jgi:hypothetical protein
MNIGPPGIFSGITVHRLNDGLWTTFERCCERARTYRAHCSRLRPDDGAGTAFRTSVLIGPFTSRRLSAVYSCGTKSDKGRKVLFLFVIVAHDQPLSLGR